MVSDARFASMVDRHQTAEPPEVDYEECEACQAENLADDQEWVCPYERRPGPCKDDRNVDEAMDRVD
jgi:hypothetical protein